MRQQHLLERKVCAAEHGVDHLDIGVALKEIAKDLSADRRSLVDAAAIRAAKVVVREKRFVLDRHGNMVHVNGDMAFVQVLEKAREDLVVEIALAVVCAELHTRKTIVEPAVELLQIRFGAKGRHGDKRNQTAT